MFDDFDFKVLDDPGFKEDAVREELIAPIIKRLGFLTSGELRVERSKSLVHPFVMIGAKKHKVHIVPDYTLYKGSRALCILEAKAPTEGIRNTKHTEQAYSYAIHPEVRASHYALCNGRQLLVYAVSQPEPLLSVDVVDAGSRWEEVQKALGPRYLSEPDLRDFMPDFGLALHRLGLGTGFRFAQDGFMLQYLGRVDTSTVTVSSTAEIAGVEHMLSIDLATSLLPALVEDLPRAVRSTVMQALHRAPHGIDLAAKVRLDGIFELGAPTRTYDESIAPLHLLKVRRTYFDPSAVRTGDPTLMEEWPKHTPIL